MIILNLCLLSFVSNVLSAGILTINKGSTPFWHQLSYSDQILDGNKLPNEITYNILTFEPVSSTFYRIKTITNFPTVSEIRMEKYGTNIVPVLQNLPQLKKISLQNNQLKEIKNNALSDTALEHIILSSNKITKIQDGSFGDNVVDVTLTCNNLTQMSPTWFRNPRVLRTLSINGNKLREIPKNMFNDFEQLENLNLRNNEILTIGDGAFTGLKKMSTIQLSYNNISEIKPSALGNTIEVYKFDIQYNKLGFLHPFLLNKLDLTEIRIWGNPWQCPCRDELYNWWYDPANDPQKKHKKLPTVKRDGDPSCVFAKSFADVCVYAVDKELDEYYFEYFQPQPIKFCEIFA